MINTGFTVPFRSNSGELRRTDLTMLVNYVSVSPVPATSSLSERPEGMAYVSGGQGLWSTVDDYLTFARMFLNEGHCE